MNRDVASVIGWHKSSYSSNGGIECVEVGWHISSYSANGGAECVEAGPYLSGPPRFAVRDSTQRDLGFLSFPSLEWSAFVTGVKTGEH